jgi:hypothetical protein
LFEDLPAALYPSARDAYIDELFRHNGSAKVFANTGPGYIHSADLLAAVFPNVRILCVKRNVEDTALRIYQRIYDAGHFYSYDLKTARDHVVWYHQVIDLLQKTFPALVRVIRYEEMVTDPVAALRTAADLCGLPMTDRPPPPVGDDRGCAAPYRQFINAELSW